MRRLVTTLLVAGTMIAFPPAALGAEPASVGPGPMHETTARTEWDLTSPGAPSTADTFLTVWTRSDMGPDTPAGVTGVFSTNRFTCDASSDTWRFRWSYGTFDAGRGAFTVSNRGATLDATVQIETRENTGSGCATADRYASPGTLIANGTAWITAGWTVEGDWQAARSCWLNQAGDLLYVGMSRWTREVSAWLTLSGALQLTVGADRLTSASLWRDQSSTRPNNGQWPCGPQ